MVSGNQHLQDAMLSPISRTNGMGLNVEHRTV